MTLKPLDYDHFRLTQIKLGDLMTLKPLDYDHFRLTQIKLGLVGDTKAMEL